MKVTVERECRVIRRGTVEVEDVNESTLRHISDMYIMESDPEYLPETNQILRTKIYSEDRSVLLYGK